MSFFNRFLRRFIKFFGSLRLALGLELLIGFIIAIAAVFFFGWLAGEMLGGDTARFDDSIRAFVHTFASPVLTKVMQLASFLGSTLFLVLFGITVFGIFYYFKRRRAAVLFAIATIGATILLVSLKLAFRRVRPEPFFDTILPASFSFPSRHSLASFCFYLALAAIVSNRIKNLGFKILIWIFSAALVLLIGISRIYLGVHYSSDVVAGFVIGFIWVITIAVADRLLRSRKVES
ncbi:phosphatase PAP2 family protein [soil metagenome]